MIHTTMPSPTTTRLLPLALLLCLACGDDPAQADNRQMRDTSQDLATWRSCLATPKAYQPFEDSISTIGRVQGYETIAKLLWRNPAPMPDDFTQANLTYVAEEGLDSRVSRREDERFPPVLDDDGKTLECRDQGVPERSPNRCVGPAILRPSILDALTEGAKNQGNPGQLAARIQADLQWFLVISVYKEARTCIQKKKDCDSSYAYYTGGDPTGMAVGLAHAVAQADMAAHTSVLRAIQGIGCWRAIDSEDQAQNIPLATRATDYLDAALLHAASALMITRLETPPLSAADWTWLQAFGRYLDTAAQAKNPADAGKLSAMLSSPDPQGADPAAIKAQLAALFPLPPQPTASEP